MEAEAVRVVGDEGTALRLGERLSATSLGVVVAKQASDPELGEYDEPVILAVHGQVPSL